MPSKTFVPAFEAKVGNWTYYSCLMSYAQVAREINFAHELGGNQDLGTMIQRGVGDRTKQITDYLLTNENRFLGAIIIAVWGGDPNYLPLEMDEDAAEPGCACRHRPQLRCADFRRNPAVLRPRRPAPTQGHQGRGQARSRPWQ